MEVKNTIVKDFENTYSHADSVSNNLLKILKESVKSVSCPDDPAEYIYLTFHAASQLIAKIIFMLEGYGEIYGLKTFTQKKIKELIQKYVKDYLDMNSRDNKKTLN